MKKTISTIKMAAFIVLVLSTAFVRAGALEKMFAPESILQKQWLAHDNTSTQNIDHSQWNNFLNKNVIQTGGSINRIAYANVTDSDKRKLQSYIDVMQKIKISHYNRDEQLAYWINLYNSVTVNVVLLYYPVISIRDIDISPGLFSDGPWDKKLLRVENNDLSLNDIEHGILRPVWEDARIHYAVNCASVSCPDLSHIAYSSKNISQQLDEAARRYIAHPRAVHINKEGVVVSSIYSWFQQDFGEKESDVIKHIQKYAPPALSRKIEGTQFFADDEYDWSLNDALVVVQ